jgi:hypothetical protein
MRMRRKLGVYDANRNDIKWSVATVRKPDGSLAVLYERPEGMLVHGNPVSCPVSVWLEPGVYHITYDVPPGYGQPQPVTIKVVADHIKDVFFDDPVVESNRQQTQRDGVFTKGSRA